MCCFSGAVNRVAKTRIFARADKDNLQSLAYQMEYSTAQDVAMLLPLPIAPGAGEHAVRFINLEEYADFFADLKAAFPEPPTKSAHSRGPVAASAAALPVAQVGSFEASFVPTRRDFSRLDPRFRMPEGVWKSLPQYATYGFAVFKLRKDAETVHPMAFEFPRADATQLFFPTLHVHDGVVHEEASFDHALYCQVSGDLTSVTAWRESPQLARQVLNVDKAKGLFHPDGHVYFRAFVGSRRNQDILV
jgi:hypothetical protein